MYGNQSQPIGCDCNLANCIWRQYTARASMANRPCNYADTGLYYCRLNLVDVSKHRYTLCFVGPKMKRHFFSQSPAAHTPAECYRITLYAVFRPHLKTCAPRVRNGRFLKICAPRERYACFCNGNVVFSEGRITRGTHIYSFEKSTISKLSDLFT